MKSNYQPSSEYMLYCNKDTIGYEVVKFVIPYEHKGVVYKKSRVGSMPKMFMVVDVDNLYFRGRDYFIK